MSKRYNYIKAVKRVLNKLGIYKEYSPNIDFKGQLASDAIRRLLLSEGGGMVARYGGTELNAVSRYVARGHGKLGRPFFYLFDRCNHYWYDEKISNQMKSWSGFINPSYNNLDKFSELMLKDSEYIDILGCWLQEEKYVLKYFNHSQKIMLGDIEPYYHEYPWSIALEGKKVLVIHPFSKTIEKQYSRRTKIHNNKNILPEFELLTYRPVQSIGEEESVEYSDWFGALEKMKEDVSDIKFDVALIGAGAYGFPLAAHIKRREKKAVHMGGALQVMFGIKGKRWEDDKNFQAMFNDYWTYPLDEERPKGFRKVEGGCYW
ncbi:MAG: hypothetical protein ACWA44_11690 [Thiotrichales bacterium]